MEQLFGKQNRTKGYETTPSELSNLGCSCNGATDKQTLRGMSWETVKKKGGGRHILKATPHLNECNGESNKPLQTRKERTSFFVTFSMSMNGITSKTPFHCANINHDLTMVNWLPYKKAKLADRIGNVPIPKFIPDMQRKRH
ncbi:hypothetical protein CDAR_402161 [Caerostris darwini]|uniref:Uncharacterized protein n=1 Tax=Caerostris darwini TaxID=1538125 RepID=A0AAV4SXV9_9ARAC|nr:hypothetical protein CDAR_402161 [Caerostris darwini]